MLIAKREHLQFTDDQVKVKCDEMGSEVDPEFRLRYQSRTSAFCNLYSQR